MKLKRVTTYPNLSTLASVSAGLKADIHFIALYMINVKTHNIIQL